MQSTQVRQHVDSCVKMEISGMFEFKF